MAVDMFLKIDGVKGESSDDKHKEEIDIESFSWGVSTLGTSGQGGGGGAGKVNVQDATFSKFVDKSSPELMLACANGKHFPTADFVVRKAGTQALEYLKYKFSDLLITSLQTGGGGERVSETIAINFAKVEFSYFPQNKDGSAAGAVTAGWDVKANKKA